MREQYTLNFGVTLDDSRVVAQQSGLNAGASEAKRRYARVIVQVQEGSVGTYALLHDPLLVSTNELAEVDRLMRNDIEPEAHQRKTAGLTTQSITSWSGTSVVHAAGFDCLMTEYNRAIEGGPEANVRIYQIMNNDRLHFVHVAYRVAEHQLWAQDLGRVIDTFDFIKR